MNVLVSWVVCGCGSACWSGHCDVISNCLNGRVECMVVMNTPTMVQLHVRTRVCTKNGTCLKTEDVCGVLICFTRRVSSEVCLAVGYYPKADWQLISLTVLGVQAGIEAK